MRTVHVTLAAQPSVKAIVLVDATPEFITLIADMNPETFVFTFLTGPLDDVLDYTGLPVSNYIVLPYYIGNIVKEDHANAINKVIQQVFEGVPVHVITR